MYPGQCHPSGCGLHFLGLQHYYRASVECLLCPLLQDYDSFVWILDQSPNTAPWFFILSDTRCEEKAWVITINGGQAGNHCRILPQYHVVTWCKCELGKGSKDCTVGDWYLAPSLIFQTIWLLGPKSKHPQKLTFPVAPCVYVMGVRSECSSLHSRNAVFLSLCLGVLSWWTVRLFLILWI